MALFSRNPRFRSLSKLYGFLIIISAGTLHWLRLHQKSLLKSLASSIASITQGKDPLDMQILRNSINSQNLQIKDPNFLSILNKINSSESRKNLLINQEEFIKMQIYKDLHNKTKL